MTDAVNAGGRLDRLPIGRFHHRIIWLIGVGMFFDGFDIYTAGTVLGATLKGGFSTMGQNALFVSATFVGMMAGLVPDGLSRRPLRPALHLPGQPARLRAGVACRGLRARTWPC